MWWLFISLTIIFYLILWGIYYISDDPIESLIDNDN